MLILPTLLGIKRAFGSTVQQFAVIIPVEGYKRTSSEAFPGTRIITEAMTSSLFILFALKSHITASILSDIILVKW